MQSDNNTGRTRPLYVVVQRSAVVIVIIIIVNRLHRGLRQSPSTFWPASILGARSPSILKARSAGGPNPAEKCWIGQSNRFFN